MPALLPQAIVQPDEELAHLRIPGESQVISQSLQRLDLFWNIGSTRNCNNGFIGPLNRSLFASKNPRTRLTFHEYAEDNKSVAYYIHCYRLHKNFFE